MSKLMWGRASDSPKDAEKEDSSVSVESQPAPKKDVTQTLEDLDSRLEQLAEMQAEMQEKLRPLDSIAEMAKGNGSSNLGQIELAIDSLTERLQALTSKLDDPDSAAGPLALAGAGSDPEKLKHLNALIRLAESKVIDADKMAESMVSEAEERAKAEEERLLAEAREKARAEEERLMAEAEQKAELVRASAEQDGEKLLEEKMNKAEEEADRIKREADALLLKSKQLLEGEIQELFDQAHNRLQSIQSGEDQT
jgi:F0F1-type ATP synthase membrane subunit b/b'